MYESIPAELKRLPNWVNWRFADDPDRPDRKRKIPINPVTLDAAQSNNPATWASFDVAVGRLSSGVDGIGFMFAPAPDGTRYFGVDLDGCRDATTGAIASWAQEIIERLDSYTEVSPSGTGVHILCFAELPHALVGNQKKRGQGTQRRRPQRGQRDDDPRTPVQSHQRGHRKGEQKPPRRQQQRERRKRKGRAGHQ